MALQSKFFKEVYQNPDTFATLPLQVAVERELARYYFQQVRFVEPLGNTRLICWVSLICGSFPPMIFAHLSSHRARCEGCLHQTFPPSLEVGITSKLPSSFP
jgi:hypothetical protein